MRMATDIGMDCDGEDELVILSVKVVEVIKPQILNHIWVNPAMAVGCLLDKHHGWQAVSISATYPSSLAVILTHPDSMLAWNLS